MPHGGAQAFQMFSSNEHPLKFICLWCIGLKLACYNAQVLQKICWFVVLAATSSDQVTLLNTTAADKKLEALPVYKELLQTFITQEASPHLPHVNGANSSLHTTVCIPLRMILPFSASIMHLLTQG